MMALRTEHRVEFLSPGTFMSEATSKAIREWDSVEAVAMSKGIEERHGATPYGFRFKTYITHDPIPDGHGDFLKVEPKVVAKSGIYYITGTIRSIEQVVADDIADEMILRSNMLCNHVAYIICNTNSYRTTMEFEAEDYVVDLDGKIVARGSDLERQAYREKIDATVAKLRKKQ